MDTSGFVQRQWGHGLIVHSKKLTKNIAFHIAGPPKYSLEELLVAELKREIMIQISGLDDSQWSLLTSDLLPEGAVKLEVHAYRGC